MRPVWALYASTPTEILQRLVSLNILWNFDFPGKVMMKRAIITVVVSSVGDR
jgi:hypothetical protein